jgi:photosystem II stability/assembly factor-like uncharacterized protein
VRASTWQPIGPSGGDFLGSISNPENPDELITITTGSVYSKIYKSFNGGETWTSLNSIPAYYARDMCAYDFSTIFFITSAQCYRSTDQGQSWNSYYFNVPNAYPIAVCVDPSNSNNVYAAGVKYDYDNYTYSFAFFKSSDSAQTWNASFFFEFDYFYPYCIAIAKTNPNVIYAGGYGYQGEDYSGLLFKTTNAGLSWTDISSTVDPLYTTRTVYSVAVDPTDQNNVYLAAGYMYRSTNAGASWYRGTYVGVLDVTVDPVDTSKIYASGYDNMFTSTDYAQTFTSNYDCIKGYARNIEVAPADNSKIYVSSICGFFKSNDLGSSWETSHQGINATVIPAFAVAQSNPEKLVIEDFGVGMMLSSDSGNTWSEAGYFGDCGNIADIVIDQKDSNLVLALEGDG